MSGKKRSGNEDKAVKILILVTAIIQLISVLAALIGKLIE